MINARELMLNNWVQDAHGKPYRIMHIADLQESIIFPVPLTADRLTKAGFNWSIYHQAFHFGDPSMNEFYDINECYPNGYILSTFKKKEIIGQGFFYVHQLQNLYFALTGEELEINLLVQ